MIINQLHGLWNSEGQWNINRDLQESLSWAESIQFHVLTPIPLKSSLSLYNNNNNNNNNNNKKKN